MYNLSQWQPNSINENLETLWYPEMFTGVCGNSRMERPRVFQSDTEQG